MIKVALTTKRSMTLELLPLVPATQGEVPPGSAFGPVRNYLEAEVYYNEGGLNYFNGSKSARGYYLRVTPVTRQKTASGEVSGFTLFTGQALLLEPAKRFSAKVFAKIALQATQHPQYDTLKQSVIRKNHLTLAVVVS